MKHLKNFNDFLAETAEEKIQKSTQNDLVKKAAADNAKAEDTEEIQKEVDVEDLIDDEDDGGEEE